MKQQEVLEVFCHGCQFYSPDWSWPVDMSPLPCKKERLCKELAKKTEILLKEVSNA